ncbi:unnamed protein product, partial [Symbiodinium necroappetens]
ARLLAEGLSHLEELRFFFDNEVALTDLDTMLEDVELRDVKQAFWKRCRMRFPAEVHPADSLLSRVSRELSKRMRCVFAAWKDADTYLDKLYTLLLAYSMAGVHPLPGVDASKEASLRYRRRSEWVTRFREGTSSLGVVIKQVMEARDAHCVAFSGGCKVGGNRVAAVLKAGVEDLASASEAPDDMPPLMMDLMCGPNDLSWEEFQLELRSSLDQSCLQFADNCACKFVLDEQQKILERGGGAIRENPSNSLHWCIPQEAEMWASDPWWDARYDAYCFMGARRKRQRLQHNIWELTQDPSMLCHHTHQSEEWKPWESNGQVVYSSKEEAEYTAPFACHVAVACSWWHAGLVLPSCATSAMQPGYRFESQDAAARCGVRGSGSPLTPSACDSVGLAVRPDHNCGVDEWPALYVEHILANLQTDLRQLEGKSLACDCTLSHVCDGALVPQLVSAQQRQWQRTAEGREAGAMAHRAALPPVLPFGLSPAMHFSTLPVTWLVTPPPSSKALLWISMFCNGGGRSRKGLPERQAPSLDGGHQSIEAEVTQHRDIGLLALLCLLVSWGDATLPADFLFGMVAINTAPWYGVFPDQPCRLISQAEVLQDAEASNARVRASLRPGRDDDFLLAQSLQDAILQAKACDTTLRAPGRIGQRPTAAVRWIVPLPVVVWWRGGTKGGVSLAVTSFNRYNCVAEALGRRLLAILVSMYFDDAHLTDWASSKGSAQAAFASLNTCLGSPFAETKRQKMASTGTFLGLNFDFTECLWSGVVRFFVHDRLVEKVQDLIHQALSTNSLLPGLAAKLYGTCNFLEQGMYGHVGAGGLRAIRERADQGGRELTPPIHTCFALIRAVLSARPEREFDILPRVWPRFLAASDAAEDTPGEGSGGFHLVWLDTPEVWESFVAEIGHEVYACFSPGDQKIAQLELAMVLYALAVRAPAFRGRRGFWYIDNVAALMSLIRGRSSSPDLERLAQLIHLAMFALRTSFSFEYIPSKTNWADAVSRVGFSDAWLHQRGFGCHVACFPFQLVDLPFLAVLRVFEFL